SLSKADHSLGRIVDIRAIDSRDSPIPTIRSNQYMCTIQFRRADGLITSSQSTLPSGLAISYRKEFYPSFILIPVIIVVIVKNRTGGQYQCFGFDTPSNSLRKSTPFTDDIQLIEIWKPFNSFI